MIFSSLGTKGGSCKSALAFLACRGWALLDPDQRVILAITDFKDTTQNKKLDGRGHIMIDARTPEGWQKLIAIYKRYPDSIVFLDGGRPTEESNSVLTAADIALIPFAPYPEDIRTALEDAERYPEASLYPSRMPANAFARDKSQKLIDSRMAHVKGRILEHQIPFMNSVPFLMDGELGMVTTETNNLCRAVARQLNDLAVKKLGRSPMAKHNTA